jgi:cytochrome d ubiquinol oxidase subunit II
LLALILRAVSIEFRNGVQHPTWRRAFDLTFGIGSLLPAILFGVAVGNILRGVPVDFAGNWTGSFLGLLNPYSVLIGLVSLAFFTMHGAIYLSMKASGDYAARLSRWAMVGYRVFMVLFMGATVATGFVAPHLFKVGNPFFWVFSLLLFAGAGGVQAMLVRGKPFHAFIASAVTIVAMIGEAGVGLFPRLVPSSINLNASLTIYNACSTPRTLTVMLVIALVGMPIVIGYTAVIYRVFRGKAVTHGEGY